MHVNTIILQAFAEAVQGLPTTGRFEFLPTFPLGDHDLSRQLDLVRTGAIRLGKSVHEASTSGRPKGIVLDRAQEVVVTVGYAAQEMGDVYDFQDNVVGPLERAIAESDLLATVSRTWFLAGSKPLVHENIVSAIVQELTWVVNVKTVANNPDVAVG